MSDVEWYYQDYTSIHAIVVYSIGGFLFLLGLVFLFMCSRKGSHEPLRVTKVINYSLFFMLEFTIFAGRLNFLLGASGSYSPMVAADNQDLAYTGPAYTASTPVAVLEENGCHVLARVNSGNTTLSAARSNLCEFMFVEVDATIFVDGFSRFSAGLGMTVFILLEATVCIGWLYVADRHRNNDSLSWKRRLLESLGFHLLFLCIASQQSLVLMPIANMQANKYCYNFAMPTGLSLQKGVCLHRWATYGVPVGLPLAVGGIAVTVAVVGSQAAILAVLFVILALCGIGLFSIWLFAGMGYGVWIHFTTFYQQIVFLVSELAAPATFTITDVILTVLNIGGFMSDSTFV